MILLKLLGVAFVSFLGVLPNRSTEIETKETPTKQTTLKYRQLDSANDIELNTDTIYLFVAKNYEDNGEGAFYNGSINLYNSYRYTAGSINYVYSFADFTLVNGDSHSLTRLSFYFGDSFVEEETQQTIYGLRSVALSDYDTGGNNTYYVYSCTTTSGTFNRSNCSFFATQITFFSQNVLTLINDLFDIYTFEESTFTFNSNFNYNAPYGFMTSSTFVNQSSTTYNIDLPWFYCNGLAFNRIALVYVDGISTRYIDQNGDLQINTTTGTSYYSLMQYVNTATNYSVMVNSRNFSTYTDSDGYIQTYLNNGSQWVNDSYRTITFSDTLTPTQIDGLTIFNTNLNTGYIDNTTGVVSDIGLGSVFSLIATAFGSLSGFLAIQIMPGLTLGLLLFTPLIVGIILAIVWLVKR